MNQTLISSVEKLTESIAQQLNLKVLDIVFQNNQIPATLRIDIENLSAETSLNNCEQMSRLLEEALDQENVIPTAYTLEISSPGISNHLTSDREFVSFKGFPIIVQTNTIFKKKTEWAGRLQGRDETSVYLNCKGKIVTIPRDIVTKVELTNS